MEEKQKRAILLAVAFLLPLLFIMTVFITSYIPSASLTTNYNFIYATCSEGSSPYSYYCSNYLHNLYEVDNNRLLEQEIPADLDSDGDGTLDINENYRTRIFMHHTDRNESEEISLIDAQRLNLDERISSPDGVAVEWEFTSGGNFFPFVRYSSNYGYFLTRGSAKQRLNLINDSERTYYRDDFLFLGWIIEP